LTKGHAVTRDGLALRQERLTGSRSREERRRAAMAKSPVAGKYDVTIDPNSA
jgi:hypothetical protein